MTVATKILTASLENGYFSWLCARIDCRRHENYETILRDLYSTTFYSLVPNDNNRALDGADLRIEYEQETNLVIPRRDMSRPCSVLEMMIALSERMAFILSDLTDNELGTETYFWELISNLKLKPNSNKNYKILDDFLERRYRPSGEGGLFPLRQLVGIEDQRNVEIWYQMMAYINEKY